MKGNMSGMKGYDKAKAGYKANMSGGTPNDGENTSFYDGSAARSATTGIQDSAGVEYGLSELSGISVKNAESVCVNQRPKSNKVSITSRKGSFEIGA